MSDINDKITIIDVRQLLEFTSRLGGGGGGNNNYHHFCYQQHKVKKIGDNMKQVMDEKLKLHNDYIYHNFRKSNKIFNIHINNMS